MVGLGSCSGPSMLGSGQVHAWSGRVRSTVSCPGVRAECIHGPVRSGPSMFGSGRVHPWSGRVGSAQSVDLV